MASVLVIGAAGRTGLEIVRSASKASPAITVHAFTHTTDLPSAEAALCASVIKGDARKSADLERALSSSGADVVVITIGIPNNTNKDDVREASAKALMDVMGPGSKYEHVKLVVVSSTGAGGTKLKLGMGVGTMVTHALRHVMKDHDNQENEFNARLGASAKNRMLIVRPTGLADGKPTGNISVFGNGGTAKGRVNRADLGKYIVDQINAGKYGHSVCCTAH